MNEKSVWELAVDPGRCERCLTLRSERWLCLWTVRAASSLAGLSLWSGISNVGWVWWANLACFTLTIDVSQGPRWLVTKGSQDVPWSTLPVKKMKGTGYLVSEASLPPICVYLGWVSSVMRKTELSVFPFAILEVKSSRQRLYHWAVSPDLFLYFHFEIESP